MDSRNRLLILTYGTMRMVTKHRWIGSGLDWILVEKSWIWRALIRSKSQVQLEYYKINASQKYKFVFAKWLANSDRNNFIESIKCKVQVDIGTHKYRIRQVIMAVEMKPTVVGITNRTVFFIHFSAFIMRIATDLSCIMSWICSKRL